MIRDAALVLVASIVITGCAGPATPSATAVASATSATSAHTTPPGFATITVNGLTWSARDGPDASAPGVTWWLQGSAPDGSAPIAAIFRPGGEGPFPVVVYLHASEGLTPDQLSLGPTLSAAGFIAVIGCHTGVSALLRCKKTPPEPVGPLIDLAKRIPGARNGPVGLAGCSIGGAAAFALGAERDDVAAIVVDSTAGFVEVTPKAPVLVLTSNQDNSLVVADAHRYEAMFRERGVTVEAKYYDNGGHMVMFSAAIRDDARQRAVTFLRKYLKP